MMWHGCKIDDLIQGLPFKSEVLSNISKNSNFILFSDTFSWMFGYNHVEQFSNYVNETCILDCGVNEGESYNPNVQLITTLKYPYAFDNMLRGLNGEDMVLGVHLPYLVEAESDFRCSVMLFMRGYYKQALQTLRTTLEVTVAHAYFGLHGKHFHQLSRNSDFRMPRFRSKRGMLTFLVEKNLLGSTEAKNIAEIYGELSGAVHSEIDSLNIMNQASRFERETKWYKYGSEVGIVIIKIVLNLLKKGF